MARSGMEGKKETERKEEREGERERGRGHSSVNQQITPFVLPSILQRALHLLLFLRFPVKCLSPRLPPCSFPFLVSHLVSFTSTTLPNLSSSLSLSPAERINRLQCKGIHFSLASAAFPFTLP